MVELYFFPAAFHMAILAFLAISALVLVVLAMTCNTFMRNTFEL